MRLIREEGRKLTKYDIFCELYVYIMESGTCYLLDLVLNEEGQTYTKYGMLQKRFLKEHSRTRYQNLLLYGRLTEHLN